ncbi:MAG: hypothetical protein LLG04_00880 [Parachlamydia sp.]|nr:hypothetical protein [Parachlamydia sp.]
MQASQKDIYLHLQEAGFVQHYISYSDPPAQSYHKTVNGIDLELEFLTDDNTRGDKNQNVLISGIVAQPLTYLSLSLKTTVKFKTFFGIEGNVVAPGAWLFHKGLTFTRRAHIEKSFKDLYGLWWVASQLGDFSQHAIAELHALSGDNPKWSYTFRTNLQRWIENASTQDWSKLMVQDTSNKLEKNGFLHTINLLIGQK